MQMFKRLFRFQLLHMLKSYSQKREPQSAPEKSASRFDIFFAAVRQSTSRRRSLEIRRIRDATFRFRTQQLKRAAAICVDFGVFRTVRHRFKVFQ